MRRKRSQTIVIGVGMPAALKLDEFGSHVWSVFGHPPYLVGSALLSKEWRDVDVRVILPDDQYEADGLGEPGRGCLNGKWVALSLAFSSLGREMTGLPIDFQIQQQSDANQRYPGPRNAIGMIELRLKK